MNTFKIVNIFEIGTIYAIVLHMAAERWRNDVARVDIWWLISKLQFHSIYRDAVETWLREGRVPLTLTTVLDPINVRNSVIRISLLGRLRTFVFDLVPVLNVSYIINASLALVQLYEYMLRWSNNRLVEKIWKFPDFSRFSRVFL